MNPWPALLRSPPPDLSLVHELGLPHDPSSIWGRERLTVRPDGQAVLEWWQGQERAVWDAHVDPRVVRRWASLLAEGGFPEFPAAPPSGGASVRIFEAHHAGRAALAELSRFDFEEVAPFEDLCAIADSVCAAIRRRPAPDPDPARRAVSDVHRR
jgi:hypothetical protein